MHLILIFSECWHETKWTYFREYFLYKIIILWCIFDPILYTTVVKMIGYKVFSLVGEQDIWSNYYNSMANIILQSTHKVQGKYRRDSILLLWKTRKVFTSDLWCTMKTMYRSFLDWRMCILGRNVKWTGLTNC